jgi:hypothetical protein
MTIYCEDPHDTWSGGDPVSRAKDHAGRGLFWMEALVSLSVFWGVIAWCVYRLL